MPTYELRSLKLPKLTGAALKAYAAAAETSGVRAPLIGNMMSSGGIRKLHALPLDESPTFTPLVQPTGDLPAPEPFEPGERPANMPYHTIMDFARAYRSGALTPLRVAEAFTAALQASEQGPAPLRAFSASDSANLLAQARAATQRFAEGHPLGLLDGVPLALKDEIDMLPYPTSVGTAFLGAAPAKSDSTVAARLRAAGALLTGKTNMHEIGINPNGSNAHWGSVRNPFNDACDTGGSSSGSAAAVAAGLVPAAIGADGGSSGPIEWVGGITDNTVTPPKGHIVPAGQWTTLSFFLPYEPARSFYLGDGVLTSTTGKGVFEHLEFVPGGGLGTYNVWLDNFRVTDLGP